MSQRNTAIDTDSREAGGDADPWESGKIIRDFFSKTLLFLGPFSHIRNYTNYYFLFLVSTFITFIISTVVVLSLGAIWAFFPAFTGILLGFALTAWYEKTAAYREKIYEVHKIVRDLSYNVRNTARDGGDTDGSVKRLFLSASHEIDTTISQATKMGISADDFQKDFQKELEGKYQGTLKAIYDTKMELNQKIDDILLRLGSTTRIDEALPSKNTGKVNYQ